MDIVDVIVLPDSGDVLVVYLDGRAIRIRPDGSTVPPMPFFAETFVASAIRIQRIADRERGSINQPSYDARRPNRRVSARVRWNRLSSTSP